MNFENNTTSLFNKLPSSILSTIFVLAQNPQLSLLNKNMHYASQQVYTISKYILQHALSDTQDNLESNLSTKFEKYTKININETIGALVLSKVKKLDYKTALDLAIKYKWRNILNKLLKMYVVIDKSISTVVQMGTLFMNEGEYLDIDVGDMLSERYELLRDLRDIKVSDSIYIRPLITTQRDFRFDNNSKFFATQSAYIEMLINVCNTRIEYFLEIASSVRKEIKFIDSKYMIFCLLECADEICKYNCIVLLKCILTLKFNAIISLQELNLLKNERNAHSIDQLVDFIDEYGYSTKMDFLVYIAYSYYSFYWGKKNLIKCLEDNCPNDIYQQILFDTAIQHTRDISIQRYFFKVELNSENIRKIKKLAYWLDNADFIKFLIENSDKLKGDQDKNTLKKVLKKIGYPLAQNVTEKHPSTVKYSFLEKVLKSRNINMLQLLLEISVSVNPITQEAIGRLCYIGNYEIADRLFEISDTLKDSTKFKTTASEFKVGRGLRFNKTVLCLIREYLPSFTIVPTHYFDFDQFFEYQDIYEELMAIIGAKKKDITNACMLYFGNSSRFGNFKDVTKDPNDKLAEIIDYAIENNLQNILEQNEYEACKFGYEKDLEVLNDTHYDQAKFELVNQKFEMLKLLIEYGMNIGSTSFMQKLFNIFIGKRNEKIDPTGSLILRTAYKAGDIGWIDYFISKGAKLNGRSDGFEEACRSDKVEVLQHWIKNGGVVPKSPEYPCINMACLLGNFAMVKLLVESGVDLSNPERNGVRIACRLSLKRTLKYLLSKKATLGNICRYQLEHACLIEDIGLVKMILQYYDGLGVLERKDESGTKKIENSEHGLFLSDEKINNIEEYNITKTLLERSQPIQNYDLLDGIKVAARTNNTEILKMLLAYNINLSDSAQLLKLQVYNTISSTSS